MSTRIKFLILVLTLAFLTACAPPEPGMMPPGQNGQMPPGQNGQGGQNGQLPGQNGQGGQMGQPPAQNGQGQTMNDPSGGQMGFNQADIANATPGDCTNTFIAVQPHPANSEYPDPVLNISCTDSEVIVQTNNIPNFEFVPTTPNALQARNLTYRLPRNPAPAATTTAVPMVGPAAITVNGLLIYGPTESPQDGSRDPYLDQMLDFCNGHTDPGGMYHFHARPECIYQTMDGQTGLVLAYAFDGYPILAPYICADASCSSVKEVQSGWRDANPNIDNSWERHEYVPGTSELDECNGMTLSDGSYAYFATDTFPYLIGCYRGSVNPANFMMGPGGMGGTGPGGGGNMQPPGGGGNQQPGGGNPPPPPGGNNQRPGGGNPPPPPGGGGGGPRP